MKPRSIRSSRGPFSPTVRLAAIKPMPRTIPLVPISTLLRDLNIRLRTKTEINDVIMADNNTEKSPLIKNENAAEETAQNAKVEANSKIFFQKFINSPALILRVEGTIYARKAVKHFGNYILGLAT